VKAHQFSPCERPHCTTSSSSLRDHDYSTRSLFKGPLSHRSNSVGRGQTRRSSSPHGTIFAVRTCEHITISLPYMGGPHLNGAVYPQRRLCATVRRASLPRHPVVADHDKFVTAQRLHSKPSRPSSSRLCQIVSNGVEMQRWIRVLVPSTFESAQRASKSLKSKSLDYLKRGGICGFKPDPSSPVAETEGQRSSRTRILHIKKASME
jgi:hypothetical protein